MNKPTLRALTPQFRFYARLMILITLIGLTGFGRVLPRAAQAADPLAASAPGSAAADRLRHTATLRLAARRVRSMTGHPSNLPRDPKAGSGPASRAPAAASWSRLGHGLNGAVTAMAVSGSDDYVGGEFAQVCGDDTCTSANVRVNYIAKWNSSSWTPLGFGFNNYVYAIAISGTEVYAGGAFSLICGNPTCTSGNQLALGIAKWNGSAWSGLGFGLGGAVSGAVSALAVNAGSVYAGGAFDYACGNLLCNSSNVKLNHVARWNGTAWSPLGHGFDDTVSALVFRGSDLIAGGSFLSLCGNDACNSGNQNIFELAQWNGSAWSPVGNGGTNGPVFALAASGNDLFVGGEFHYLCTTPTCSSQTQVNFVARWDGSSWSALDHGLDSSVYSLSIYGSNLVAGGLFTQSCTDAPCASFSGIVNHIAEWDGVNWSTLSHGLDQIPLAVAAGGSNLYTGGEFTQACGNDPCISGNLAMNHIAQYGVVSSLPFKVFLPLVIR